MSMYTDTDMYTQYCQSRRWEHLQALQLSLKESRARYQGKILNHNNYHTRSGEKCDCEKFIMRYQIYLHDLEKELMLARNAYLANLQDPQGF